MKTRLRSAIRYGRLVGLAALMATGLTEAAESPATAAWYETLRPGVTRGEIEGLSGGQLTRRDNVDVWAAPQGTVEFQFRGDAPTGDSSNSLY